MADLINQDQPAVPAAAPAAPAVLLCDDDPSILKVTRLLLEHRGYRVIAVDTGQSAVEQAVMQRPAVILMDLRMPGMNGLATMAALKARPETRNIPVVVFSSLEPTERASDPEQVVYWVNKPVDQTLLFEALDRALRRPVRR